jgi:hypothetical protein
VLGGGITRNWLAHVSCCRGDHDNTSFFARLSEVVDRYFDGYRLV